jgi:hypothetical protein
MKILAPISSLIVGLIAVSLTQQSLLALSQREVEEIAKQTTVKIIRIDGNNPGTGAIVQKQKYIFKGQEGYLYTVLTNCHVFLNSKFCDQENKLTPEPMPNSTGYRIETSDRQQYISEISSVKIHPNADLAIFKFFSTIEYETVRIGNAEQLSGSSKVYVFGWAVPSQTSRDRRARFFGPGNVLGVDRKAAGGYQIAHKLELLPGMSGGPLLHENGCLVGINGGGGKRDPNIQVIEFLSVPINLYANWQNIQVVTDCRATPLPDNLLFQTLHSLLEQENWQQAEAETKKLMLRGTDQTYFNGNIINNLSCSDLKIINRLWVQYSNGRFGFSVQGEIWKGVKNDYKQFEERVGWRRGYEGPLTDPPNYSLEAKRGHLPSYKLLAASDFGTFLNRLEKCAALSFIDSGIIENIISSESEPQL